MSIHPSKKQKTAQIQLPDELETYLDAIISSLCSQLEESPISPEIQKERIRVQVRRAFEEEYRQLIDAKKHLKESFQKEDKKHPEKHTDDAFSLWEEHQNKLKSKPNDPDLYVSASADTTLQQRLQLPWAFLDRVYNHALSLLHKKRFYEAEIVFRFLKHLNPTVFEYWLGEATSAQEQGNFEKALATYNYCLSFSKFLPLIQYQIAQCFKQLKNNAQALDALQKCLRAADEEDTNILEDAKALQKELSRKSA